LAFKRKIRHSSKTIIAWCHTNEQAAKEVHFCIKTLSDVSKSIILCSKLFYFLMNMKSLLTNMTCILGSFLLLVSGCTSEQQQPPTPFPDQVMHDGVSTLTEIIVYDIFSPPVASRIYAYPNLAAYEVLRQAKPSEYPSITAQMNGFEAIPAPESGKNYHFTVAAMTAFYEVSRKLVFSTDLLDERVRQLDSLIKAHQLPDEVVQRSKDYGKAVAAVMFKRMDTDHYKETRGYPRYTVGKAPANWQPTLPDYRDAVEPHWGKMLPFVLDSAAQFKPVPPPVFDLKKGSLFASQLEEVYQTSKTLSQEQRDIAAFWDCNPYVSHQKGHLMFGTKKITPGGHWMGIAGIACVQAKTDITRSAQTYALTAVALHDGFVSCWDEKYRSNLIRPETLIRTGIDPEWKPLLQTPPFPEYTSGHSVISNAAAQVLTRLYGSNFAYTDTVELAYGLPSRKFTSFEQAAAEAAISRMYGGIHYRAAIENGSAQGREVGKFIGQKIKLGQNIAAAR
jgi:hypothetical protein